MGYDLNKMQGHIDILGIGYGYTIEEIKRIHREKTMLYHPDRNHGFKEEAEEKMKKINSALSYITKYYEYYTELGKVPCNRQKKTNTSYEKIGKVVFGYVKIKKNGKYGFIDKYNNKLVDCIYENVGDFSDGFAEVKRNEKRGFINTTGKEIIKVQYDRTEPFHNGFAKFSKDGVEGEVDIYGRETIKEQKHNFKQQKNEQKTVKDTSVKIQKEAQGALLTNNKLEVKIYKKGKGYFEGKILPVSHIPQKNDYCKSSRFGNIKLIKELSIGSIGITYLTDNGLVAKIYNEDKITDNRYDKLRIMLNSYVFFEGICWPLDIIKNIDNEFVGYVMPKAEGKTLKNFFTSEGKKEFPNLKRQSLVSFILQMLEMIQYLYDKKIFLGDINPANIFLTETNIYLIDTDSFQIQNYNCPPGNIEFIPPELQGKNFGNLLRDFDYEYFTISVFLFQLLSFGRHPYSKREGGNIGEDTKNQDFVYPFKNMNDEDINSKEWNNVWNNLSYELKESFYLTFKENKRFDILHWQKILLEYMELLKNGYVEGTIPI